MVKESRNVFDFDFVFDSIPDKNKTQKLCDIAVSLYPFLIVYCPDKYITQMCDDFSAALRNLFPIGLFQVKWLKILYYFEDSGDASFFDEIDILCVNLNKTNLDNDFDEDDLDVIILIKLLAWQSKFKKHKAPKKDKWRINTSSVWS